MTGGLTPTIEPAVVTDAPVLSALHHAILPGSRLSLFGRGYLASCYRYLIASPEELVLVARSNAAIVGGAFVSLAPVSLSRRLATRTPLLLQVALRPFGRGARQIIVDLLRPAPPAPDLPELVAIFITPSQQGRGIGEAFCCAVEAELRRRRIGSYVVHTERNPTNSAVAFYRRLGFVPAEPSKSRHRLMLLSKQLS